MKPLNIPKNTVRKTLLSAALLAGIGTWTAPANAIALIGGMGGPAGFGTLAMLPNDDGSSNLLNLPFGINFFGNNYNNFFANNNGNITFNGPVGQYTPSPFPISTQPMIAPFWADVDTRCTTCGAVYVGTPNADTVAVTWNNVGYFSGHSNLTNNFQLLLRNQGAGNFDIEFRYDRLQWTTGDASGGSGGFGGTPAQAGFDAGDGENFFTLPGSRTAAVLDLDNTSNVSPDTPGLWSFAIRSGAVPGSTPENPLMPVVVDEGFNFNFNVVLNQRRFIDPIIAIGYDYIINSGPNFASVTLPDIGDGIYSILGGALFDVLLGTVDVSLNDTFIFASGGVNRFRVLGIETSAGLDPNDPNAFVTGLSFNGTGNVNMNMNPVTLNIPDPQDVPEPVTLSLLGAGLAGITFMRRQAQRKETFKLAA